MRTILAGIAAIALVPFALHADPGGGKGGGHGGGPSKGNGDHAERAQPHGNQGDHGNQGKTRVMNDGGNARHGNDHATMRPEQSRDRTVVVDSHDRRAVRAGERSFDHNDRRGDAQRPVLRVNETRTVAQWDRRSGLINGCPPGLAKKHNGCMPPGLARKELRDRSDWLRWRGLDAGDYRYHDGYLLRMNNDRILGYVPLLGGPLAIGNDWPGDLAYAPLPDYYRSYYGVGRDDYRYYGNTIYRVDPGTSAISSIAALLTGDNFAVGQPLPSGYDVYNVPYGYRDRYADGPDANYRYSDGYVYKVDPTTQLIQTVIGLLV